MKFEIHPARNGIVLKIDHGQAFRKFSPYWRMSAAISRMAWRIEEQVLRGEIDNRWPGRVIGKSGSPDVTRRWNWSWRVEEMNAIAAEALVDLEAEKWKGPEAEEEEALATPQWRHH